MQDNRSEQWYIVEKRIAEINIELEKIVMNSIDKFKDPLIDREEMLDPILLMSILDDKYQYLQFSLKYHAVSISKSAYSLIATPFYFPYSLKKAEYSPELVLQKIEKQIKKPIIPDFNIISAYACGINDGINREKRKSLYPRFVRGWGF